MKKSIFRLSETLKNESYDPDHSEKLLRVIEDLQETGKAVVDGKTIYAAGILGRFKQNPKSIDVYLNTTSELNTLRIHSPQNTWWKADEGTEKATVLSNKKWLATNVWGTDEKTRKKREEFEKKVFIF
jgi:hypothetical protein